MTVRTDVITGKERNRLEKEMRKTLHTDAGMRQFLDGIAGPGNYTYDQDGDVWVLPDSNYSGSGRGFIIVQRGGDWFTAVLPPESLA